VELPAYLGHGGGRLAGVLGAVQDPARPELEMLSAALAGDRFVGEVDGAWSLTLGTDDDAVLGGRHTIQQ